MKTVVNHAITVTVATTVWLVAGSSIAAVAFAQEASARTRIERVYAQTRRANSLPDYIEVIENCNSLLEVDLADKDRAYIKKLLSWAQNRRGEVYADQAAALAKDGKDDEAAQRDRLALEDFNASVENDPTRWKALHNRGVNHALLGKYDQALDDFTKAIEFKDDYVNTWFNRAEIKYELGRYAAAIDDYNEVIRLNSKDAGAFTSRGHAWFQLKEFRKALEDYSSVIRIEPKNAEAMTNRADAYSSLAMWEQAARDYQRAVNLNNRLDRAYQGAAWLMATCPDVRFRNRKTALEAAQRAIGLADDGDFRYLDTLAAALANDGQFDEAVETLSKAIEAAPKNEVERLEQRLALYRENKPYRQALAPAE